MSVYNTEFYDSQEKGSLKSARAILPIIIDIIKPESVIDVGCGLGTWLSVFKELGIDDILGMDGDWVDVERLYIPKESFIATDLENPCEIERKFDLTVSLEVAEHITPENASKYINFLTEKAPVILFSAAIEQQGGTNHINEQLPEYWINHFKNYNYEVYDCIRGEIWENKDIEVWYVQNIFLFVEQDYLNKNPHLKKELDSRTKHPYSIVHPRLYSSKIEEHNFEMDKTKNECYENLKVQEDLYKEELEQKNRLHNAQIKEYNKQIEAYNNQIKTYDKKIITYEKEAKIQQNLINEILSSKSWKVTKPLRNIVKSLKSLK